MASVGGLTLGKRRLDEEPLGQPLSPPSQQHPHSSSPTSYFQPPHGLTKRARRCTRTSPAYAQQCPGTHSPLSQAVATLLASFPGMDEKVRACAAVRAKRALLLQCCVQSMCALPTHTHTPADRDYRPV